MAPGAGGKRKRGDGYNSYDSRDEHSRPSPHRPGNLSLAQQSNYQFNSPQQSPSRGGFDQRGGGRRRGSRGGRGGGSQRSPVNSPNTVAPRPTSSQGPQNIPAPPPPTQNQPPIQAQPPVEPSPVPQNPPVPANKPVVTQTPEQKPREPPAHYAYEYVTENQRKVWAESGRAEVVTAGREICRKKDRRNLALLFGDLLRAGLDGRIDGADAGSIVKEILESVAPEDIVEHGLRRWKPDDIFLDTLSICAEAWNESTALKPIVFATNISAQRMRLILDSSLLESLGLIRSTFVRVGIRQQTNLLYRQSNYNLLREETEGYSKLVTELFTTSSGEALSSELVEETFERVKGMIGAFDLDVGRVLDVTLDVFAAVLVKQYRFFVKYLRTSSWWPQDNSAEDRALHGLGTLPKWALPGAAGRPLSDGEKAAVAAARDVRDQEFWQRAKDIGIKAYFEIGNRRASSGELKQAMDAAAAANPSKADEDQTWMEVTGTLPPIGNKVAAQILGFKLKFYSSSARDASDVLPVNIIYLAALLIKIGFISLRDLYPHLWPTEDAMDSFKEAKLKENAEKERLSRPGASSSSNALANAKSLTDERLSAREQAKRREIEVAKLAAAATALKSEANTAADASGEEKEELPEPAEQKVQLLKSLLCIGAIPESLYMLGRFPWLLDAFTELPEHIHRILHHSLSKVYDPLRPLSDQPDLREPCKVLDGEPSPATKGQIKLSDGSPRKTMRWAQLDKDDTNEGIDYKFYWDDWADSIPICQTVDDVFILCSTLLNLSGVKIGQDATLLVKLCRIGRHSMDTDRSDANRIRWIDLMKRILLPALSLTKNNPGVANEVYDLIKGFSIATRYTMYAEWYQGQTSRLPEIKGAHDRTRAETRDVMKRISKSNLKSMARLLAKTAYSSPGAVFMLAISQIELYENLSEVFTECARYLTYLAYDVFNWSLLSAVGGGGKSRVQADGMLTSHWLQSLAVLIAKVYRRYSVMSPVPMLQYVVDQLSRGSSTDLIIVEQLVFNMAGIVSDTEFNDKQVEAMAGGDLLQARTMNQLLDRRLDCRTTAKRFMRTLAEPKLAGQLLVAIAQERENCVYKLPDTDAPSKLLGNLFDEVHRVLAQYIDFMRTTLLPTEFDLLVPGVASLIIEFGVEPGIAFWMSRTSISAAMATYDAAHPRQPSQLKQQSPVKELLEAEALKIATQSPGKATETGILNQLPEHAVQIDAESPPIANAVSEKAEVETKSPDQVDSIPPLVPSDSVRKQQPWHPVLREIMDQLHCASPDGQWQDLSLSFYVTFWQLSLHDMLVPLHGYEEEQKKFTKQLDAIRSDRSDISILGTQRKDREKKAISDLQSRLMSEHKDHISTYTQTRARLQKEKTGWFVEQWNRWDAMNTALIERCFFPRIRISSVDALYAFILFKYLHSSGTTNFRTLMFLDHLFKEKRLENMFFLCSAKEAENLGRFLKEILDVLGQWHADKSKFEREAYGTKKDLMGFCTKISSDKSNVTFMDYEDFRRILKKWHHNIHKALLTCFGSGEYMHIRNAINILKAIVQNFPAINFMGEAQAKSIEVVAKKETERPDLQLAAASLLGNVRRREKEWMLPQAFSLTSGDHGVNGATAARSNSAKPSTPQPGVEGSKPLNPKAPAFDPAATSNPSKPGKPGDPDAEDGEIEDAKTQEVNGHGPTTVPAGMTGSDGAKDPVPPVANEVENRREAPKQSQLQNTNAQSTPSQTPAKEATPQPQPNSFPAKQDPPAEIAGSSTPHSQPAVLPRSEPSQIASSPSVNRRAQHSLPNRPEPSTARIGHHRPHERLADRPPLDSGRDQRFPNGPGNDGRARMPGRDHPGQPSRGPESLHSRTQVPPNDRADQILPDGRPRHDIDGRRGAPARPNLRPRGDAQQPYPRENQYAGQHPLHDSKPPVTNPKDGAMPPPSSNIPHHPDRAALIQGNRNAERPLPPSQNPDRRPENSRHDDYTISGRSSRTASPNRSDERRSLRNDNRRDTRHEDRPPVPDRRNFSDSTHTHPSRYDDGRPPAGPRTERGGPSSQPGPNDRAPSTKAAIDLNHGRLSQESDYGGQQSEQYGRLNPASEVPSGPRMANGNQPSTRNVRNVSAPQPQTGAQPMQNSGGQTFQPQSPTQDRQAPRGPSSYRDGSFRDSSRHTWTRQENTSDNPATSASSTEAQDTTGIHPDRLKALQGVNSPPSTSQNPNSIQIQVGRPPPVRQQPPSVTVPRGPSSQQTPSSPAGPSPTINRGPPTGPGRGDKRFAGIQGVLQQANNSAPNGSDRGGQGTSIRGRGGRSDNNAIPPSSSTNSGPPTPSIQQRTNPVQSKVDLFAGRSTGGPSVSPQHPADNENPTHGRDGHRGSGGGRDVGRDGGREPMREGGGRENGREAIPRDSGRGNPFPSREGERESGRHHRSRSQTRDYGLPPPNGYDNRPPPSRRSDDGGMNRDMRSRGGPSASHDLMDNRDPSGRRPPRSDPERDFRRGGPPMNDPRDMGDWERGDRDMRDRRDGGSGRKRGRGDDGGSMMGGSAEKRPRRGV
ncbi:MAG: hypothetical protein L6R37_004697 [Teloschistes peruensis]|nr:MAG: hypothetical protein L6R37_004697 [Teloschistes peruensis]